MVEAESPPASLPSKRGQCLLEVAGGDTLEVEDRDQHFEALRPARVGRQNRRRKADALRSFADAVAHPRTAHRDRTNAGHDLALGQMSVAHQPSPAVFGQLVGMSAEQGGDLGLDRLRQQRSRGDFLGEVRWHLRLHSSRRH